MVTEPTQERLRKAKDRCRAANQAVRDAETEAIKAMQELSDATRQWEREFFETNPLHG